MKKVLLSAAALAVLISSANADGISVKSKAGVLKFNGTHYLGFVAKDKSKGDNTNKFETRRNYLQVKAYFHEDPKDYLRITLDTHDSKGESIVRLKYAYLYLHNILPSTSIEIGQAHRPWIDYEEHNSWNYRSISKVLTEAHNGAHLTNSADRGINFKTKLDYFSSELGVFNGEGYHTEQVDDKLSLEWRLTYHAFGTGKQKSKPNTQYANISFFGQQNPSSHAHKDEDLNWYGIHAVYNQPEFLISAQYVDVQDGNEKYAGNGYSANGEYRLMNKWNLIGRYDYFEMDKDSTEKTRTLAGISYEYNENVKFIANVLTEEVDTAGVKSVDDTSVMLTAEVEW